MGLTSPTLQEVGGWPAVLSRLTAGSDLSADEASAALDEILLGAASPVQIAAFVAALRTKRETVEEMTGLVRAMRARAEPLDLDPAVLERVVDTCGTGGDRSGSINVSTIAAFVVAGAGVPVCKHGGRAASSVAGSADVLEALGVAIELGPEGVARCVSEAGIGFCFAPRFHPAMRHAIPVRRELGIATVFNFLGPLANPAHARRQVVGVGDRSMAEKMLGVLEANGAVHAMVVYGHDGLDELSTVGPSTVLESKAGERRSFVVEPSELGLPTADAASLKGGKPEENASAARAVLSGERGPHRDVVLLNAAAGLVVAGVAADLPAGLELGAQSVDSGAAMAALDGLVATSNAAAAEG
ncbi:MAG TPA: anthranilate phosphoribosyltransferase [Acidimicrobiales bacterium]|nr:anthranilate phosphoribosyltransferase [Acidimicrobiales bacterium]